MTWYSHAKVGMNQQELDKRIKDTIRHNKFFLFLFDQYDVPIETLDDNLTFKVMELKGRFAQGNGKYIYISKKVFENGDFFKTGLHFVVHEIIHWLTKQRERKFYFADPEEIEAFAYGIMFEMLRGLSKDELIKLFYPIIEAHFDNEKNAKRLFELLYILASKRAQLFKNK